MNLGTVATLVVLGDTAVASTGSTAFKGNLVIFPGGTITGFDQVFVNGTIYDGGSVAQTAGSDAMAACLTLTSAAVGDDSIIYGNILAGESVTLDTGADLNGSAVALRGAVTMDDSTINASAIAAPGLVWKLRICAGEVGLRPWAGRVCRGAVHPLSSN